MRRLLWAIAVGAGLICGHPARDDGHHKRQGDPANSLSSKSTFSSSLLSLSMATNSSISSSFPSTLSSPLYLSRSFANSSSSSPTLPPSSPSGPLSSDSSPTNSVLSSSFSGSLSGSLVSDSSAGVFLSSASSSASPGVPSNTSSGSGATVTRSSRVSGSSAGGSASSSSLFPSGSSASNSSISSLTPASSSSSNGNFVIPISNPSSATTSSSKDGGTTASSQSSAAATITPPPELPIISVVSLSTEATSIEGVTTNTEITTEHDGHHTVVPFLSGCWFCPHSGGGGLLLWGIGPGPGIYPPPVPPPIASWPTITIGKDNVPTPAPEGDGDPESQSGSSNSEPSISKASGSSTKGSSLSSRSSSSSASCSGTTVTDYWVSCPSGSGNPSSCSTYSSSAVSGCSVSATTSVAIASCALGGPVDDSSLSPIETAGPEYDFVDPIKYFSDFPVDPYSATISASPGSSPSSTPSQTKSSSSLPNRTSATVSMTSDGTSSSSSTATFRSSSATNDIPPLCTPFQDPDNDDHGHCQCSSESFTTTTPFLTSSDDICGYTSLTIPPPSTTAPPATTDGKPFPFTTTDEAGDIIACASSSLSYLDVATLKLTFTRCDGSSTTVSTAKPSSSPPPPPPTPRADCNFWDEGWGWKFEVYNIDGWSTDGGDKLHHEEKGCGALTGWSYDQDPSGGDAYFNLPFLIKDGCVERAIVSAGGPKIACDGKGLGRRALSEDGILTARTETVAPNLDDKEVADAYDPPGIDISKMEHSYHPPNWQHTRRSRFQRRTQPPNLDDKAVADAYNPPGVDISAIKHEYTPAQWDRVKRSLLVKRGCFPSKQKPNPPGNTGPTAPQAPSFQCEPILPGVDDCNSQILAKGNVGAKRSIFYTGWGANGAPGAGAIMARKWANKNLCNDPFVIWSGALVDWDWKTAVQVAVLEAFRRPGMSKDEQFALNEKFDPFLKNLAQGFAEKSKGDVYVFIPQGQLPNNQWRMDSAWGGWEYPALTKNAEVTRILRVDLDVSDPSNPTGQPREIWKQGDAPAGYDPKGSRGATLPDGLPQDKIPAGWNGQGP